MKRSLTLFACGVALIYSAPIALSHHSISNFDMQNQVTLKATVTEFSFRNPHIYFKVQGNDAAGVEHEYLIEGHSVTGLKRRGWTQDTLQKGDEITLYGAPDKDPNKHFIFLNYLVDADGKKFISQGGGSEETTTITPSTDFSGTWDLDRRTFNIRDAGGPPPKDWPYTAEAQKLVDSFSYDENPELECLEIGVPRIVLYPYAVNFSRKNDHIYVHKEHVNEKRQIWLYEEDSIAENAPSRPVGSSFVTYESPRKLVIQTHKFTPTKWGIANGVNSSAQKQLEETYLLSEDGMSIDISFKITDPANLEEPVIRTMRLLKAADREFEEFECDTRAASRHLEIK